MTFWWVRGDKGEVGGRSKREKWYNWAKFIINSIWIILQRNTITNTVRGRERGTLILWWSECRNEEPLCTSVWRYLMKFKIKFSYDPVIWHRTPTKRTSISYVQRCLHTRAHCYSIHSRIHLDAHWLSWWMDKANIPIHNRILFSSKDNII